MQITIQITEKEAAVLLRHLNRENEGDDRLTLAQCVRLLIVQEVAEIFVEENATGHTTADNNQPKQENGN